MRLAARSAGRSRKSESGRASLRLGGERRIRRDTPRVATLPGASRTRSASSNLPGRAFGIPLTQPVERRCNPAGSGGGSDQKYGGLPPAAASFAAYGRLRFASGRRAVVIRTRPVGLTWFGFA